MSLTSCFMVSLGCFALFQFWVVPHVEAAWTVNKTVEKITKIGLVAALKSARSLFQIAFVIYGVLISCFWALQLLADASSGGIISQIEVLEDLQASIQFVSKSIIGNIILWSSLLSLAWLSFKRYRSAMQQNISELMQSESKRLMEELQNDEWEPMPSTSEMLEVEQHLEELQSFLYSQQNLSEDELSNANTTAEKLRMHHFELNLTRRMNLEGASRENKPGSRRFWPRIGTIFVSEGFTRDTRFISKALSYAGTAVLFLSIVGVNTPLINEQVTKSVVTLWELQVKASKKEAKESWDKARACSSSEAEAPGLPLDPQQVQTLARLFTDAYLTSAQWQPDAQTIRNEAHIRAASVRQQIITSHIAASPKQAFRKVGGAGHTAGENTARSLIQASSTKSNSSAKLEAQIAARIKQDIGPRNNLSQIIRTKFNAFSGAYLRPANPNEFTKAILGEIFSPAFEASKANFNSDYLKQAQSVMSGDLKSAVAESIDMQLNKFLTDLTGNRSLADALEGVSRAPRSSTGLTPNNIRSTDDFNRKLFQASEELRNKLKAEPIRLVRNDAANNFRELRVAAKSLLADYSSTNTRVSARVPDRWLDFTASYEDYFSGEKGGRTGTLRSKLLAESGFKLTPTQISESFLRSSDVTRLGRSNFVGGIVFGQNPEGSIANADITAVSWTFSSDTHVSLKLTDASGRETVFGPYLNDVTYRSLLFAADARPLVVTIMNTELYAQKVFLHPALVDTYIGCEMIELDKFIFSYIAPDIRAKQDEALARVQDYDDLYRLAKDFGLFTLVTKESKKNILDSSNRIFAAKRGRLERAVKDPALFSDPTRSPLAANYSIYYPPILRAMKTCIQKSPESIEQFCECMKLQGEERINGGQPSNTRRSEIPHLSRLSPSRNSEFDKWNSNPESLDIVSGVRDKKFSLDQNLDYLTGNNEDVKSKRTWPLSFLIQNTVPANAKSTDPWLFASLQAGIDKGIEDLTNTDANANQILQNIRDFAVLQRIFRMAFEGHLGMNFPLDQLAVLADETRIRIEDTTATKRWVLSENSWGRGQVAVIRRFLDDTDEALALLSELPPIVRLTIKKLARCVDEIENNPASDSIRATCSFCLERSELEKICEIGGNLEYQKPICDLADIAIFIDRLSKKLEVAKIMGVPKTIPTSVEKERAMACRRK